MARRRTQLPFNVFLNGRLPGALRRKPTGATNFQYTREWLACENAFRFRSICHCGMIAQWPMKEYSPSTVERQSRLTDRSVPNSLFVPDGNRLLSYTGVGLPHKLWIRVSTALSLSARNIRFVVCYHHIQHHMDGSEKGAPRTGHPGAQPR